MIEKTLTDKEFVVILEAIDNWEHRASGPTMLAYTPEDENFQETDKFKEFIQDNLNKEKEKLKEKRYPALVLKNKIFKIQDKIWTINILSTKPTNVKLNEFEILDEALELLDMPIPGLADISDIDHPLINKAAQFVKIDKEEIFETYKMYMEKKQKEVIDKKKTITELRIKLIEFKIEAETEENKAIELKIAEIMKS